MVEHGAEASGGVQGFQASETATESIADLNVDRTCRLHVSFMKLTGYHTDHLW
jgi:hypothetical protein